MIRLVSTPGIMSLIIYDCNGYIQYKATSTVVGSKNRLPYETWADHIYKIGYCWFQYTERVRQNREHYLSDFPKFCKCCGQHAAV